MPRAQRSTLFPWTWLGKVALGVALAASVPVAVAPAASAAPATPSFGPSIEGYARYEGATTCVAVAQPGVVAFRDIVRAAYPGRGGGDGIVRACSGSVSEHHEGRAWDFMLNAANPADRAIADDLLGWLLATDQRGNPHANLRRLGVMYVIWDRHIFKAYQADRGWQPYTGSSPHTDHIHFSFSRAGAAKTTSFWTGAAVNPANYAALPGVRGTTVACPPGAVPSAGFRDVVGDTHAASIDCVAWWGVAQGRSRTEFAPTARVTRAQMAQFLARLIAQSGGSLPADAPAAFHDIGGQTADAQRAINGLAAAGVVKGRSPGAFEPSALVTRAQMASFIAAAYEYRAKSALPTGADYFADDDGNVHAVNIGKLARSGLTGGTSPAIYSPERATSRAEMATFLGRTLDLLVDHDVARARA